MTDVNVSLKEYYQATALAQRGPGQWGHTKEKQASESSFYVEHLRNTNLNRSCFFVSQISVFVHTNKTILREDTWKTGFPNDTVFLACVKEHVYKHRAWSYSQGWVLPHRESRRKGSHLSACGKFKGNCTSIRYQIPECSSFGSKWKWLWISLGKFKGIWKHRPGASAGRGCSQGVPESSSQVDLVVPCGQDRKTLPKALFLLNALTHHHQNREIVYFLGGGGARTWNERC